MRYRTQLVQRSSLDPNEHGASAPLLLSLLSPAVGVRGLTNLRMHLITAGQRMPYSLLNGRPATESFLYEYQTNYLPRRRLLGSGSFTHTIEQDPPLLLELSDLEPLDALQYRASR